MNKLPVPDGNLIHVWKLAEDERLLLLERNGELYMDLYFLCDGDRWGAERRLDFPRRVIHAAVDRLTRSDRG